MASPQEHIVDFKHPPVAEVALAVQFAEPVTDDTTTLSKYRPTILTDFPDVEPQPPLPPLTETFEVPAAPSISFQVLGGPQASRYWFLGAEGNQLVQVQPDRFGYNWRKGPADATAYPRYQYVRARFESVFSVFVDTLQQLGKVVHPIWCEVTYINPVAFGNPGEPARSYPPYCAVSCRTDRRCCLSLTTQPWLIVSYSLATAFRLVDCYVTADAAYTDERSLGYNLTLRMIGQPKSQDLAGVLDVFDEGPVSS